MTTRGFYLWDEAAFGAPPTIDGYVPLGVATPGGQLLSHTYPRSANGATAGTLTQPDEAIALNQSGGWSGETDSALVRGAASFPNNATDVERIRLDFTPGTHDFRYWAGPRGFNRTRITLFQLDGTTQIGAPITTVDITDAPTGQYIGTDGTLRPLSDFALNPSIPVTLTGAGIILQIEGLSFRGVISGASLTSTAPPPVPEADTIRIQGGGNPPWHPAAGPVLGVEYSLTLEAWDSLLGVRDTAFVGDDGTVDLASVVVLPPTIVIASGGTGTWASGLAPITVTFAAAVVPPPIDPPVVVPTRNRVVTTRARSLPGGEDARLREQYNRMVQKLTALCDLLDADASVAGTGFAAAFVDAQDAPRLIADESGAVR